MLSKIFRIASHLMLPITLIFSVLIIGLTSVDALSPESDGNNPLKIVIEPSGEKLGIDNEKSMDQNKMSGIPDLGDDQVFPFVAGLDSYEGSRN